MKYASNFALTGLLFASCSAFAVTPADGWYVGLMGGASLANSINFHGPSPYFLLSLENMTNPPDTQELVILADRYFPGFTTFAFEKGILKHSLVDNFGAQLGYRLCNFRLEGELMLSYSPISSLEIGGTT